MRQNQKQFYRDTEARCTRPGRLPRPIREGKSAKTRIENIRNPGDSHVHVFTRLHQNGLKRGKEKYLHNFG